MCIVRKRIVFPCGCRGVMHVLHLFLCLWSRAYVVLLMAFFHPRGTMERHFCQTPTQSVPNLLEHA